MTKQNPPQDEQILDKETAELQEELQEDLKESDELTEIANLLKEKEKLKSDLQEKEEIAKRSQIEYLHLKSDFDILQRQTEQKLNSAERDATINVVKKFLPLVENLRKSLLNLSEEQKESTMGKGLEIMYESFLKNLETLHIHAIPALGLEPDTQVHEPVSMQASEDPALKGKIIQEFEQGFIYKSPEEEVVLIPSKVIVGA